MRNHPYCAILVVIAVLAPINAPGVPEPNTLAVFALGLILFGLSARRFSLSFNSGRTRV